MGHVYQRVKLAAVTEREVTMLVDTGATYSLVPPDLADELGVVRLPRKQKVTLANGEQIDAELGTVIVEVDGRSAGSTVVVAACDEPLLGVEALEALGLAIDPSSGTLKPTRAYTVRTWRVSLTHDSTRPPQTAALDVRPASGSAGASPRDGHRGPAMKSSSADRTRKRFMTSSVALTSWADPMAM